MTEETARDLAEGFNTLIEEKIIVSPCAQVRQDVAYSWYVGIKHDSFTSQFYGTFSLLREVSYLTKTRILEAVRDA